MAADYDLLICGGGMVGASLARALSPLGWRIALVEAVPPTDPTSPSFDDRAIALAWGSRLILEALEVWDALSPRAEPILDIHISEQGCFGAARLSHRHGGTPALGYVTTARELGRCLEEGLGQRLDLFCPARLTDLEIGPDRVEVGIQQEAGAHRFSTRLLVAADGRDSWVRRRLGIAVQEIDYAQTAIVANLSPAWPHQGRAFERFTPTGPLAILPLPEQHGALIWTQPRDLAPEFMGLDDASFLARLQQAFGQRLGRFLRIGRRSAYPLRQVLVEEQARPRILLIGNAAHTLHPVAGQGFNLGLRDVAVLAKVLREARRQGDDPGDPAVLLRYETNRRQDQGDLARLTDTMVRLFSHPALPVRLLRNLGLFGFDLCPLIKPLVTRRFMGLDRPLLPEVAPVREGKPT